MELDHGQTRRRRVRQRPDRSDDGSGAHRQERACESMQLDTASCPSSTRFAGCENHGCRHTADSLQLVDGQRAVGELDRRPQWIVVSESAVGHEVHEVVLTHGRAHVCDCCPRAGDDVRSSMASGDAARLLLGFRQSRSGDDKG